jgi:hypothetical protein
MEKHLQARILSYVSLLFIVFFALPGGYAAVAFVVVFFLAVQVLGILFIKRASQSNGWWYSLIYYLIILIGPWFSLALLCLLF